MIYFKAPPTLAVLTLESPNSVDHVPLANVASDPEARVMIKLTGWHAPPYTAAGRAARAVRAEDRCTILQIRKWHRASPSILPGACLYDRNTDGSVELDRVCARLEIFGTYGSNNNKGMLGGIRSDTNTSLE